MPEAAFAFIDDLVARYGVHAHVIANPQAISILRARLHGIFPSDAMTGAELTNDRLRITFAADQNRDIPTAMGQVGLALSRVVEFRLGPIPQAQVRPLLSPLPMPGSADVQVPSPMEAGHSLRLEVLSGGVRVNFTWILRLLAPVHLPDVQIDAIDISYSTVARAGYLSATQHFLAVPSQPSWSVDASRLAIDIALPELPWSDEVIVTASSCEFLGHRIWTRIRPEFSWTAPHGEPQAASGGRADVVVPGGWHDAVCQQCATRWRPRPAVDEVPGTAPWRGDVGHADPPRR